MDHARELMELARSLAFGAREIILEGRASAHVAGTKSSDIDIVTQMDIAAETYIRAELAVRRPLDAIMGEEGSDTQGTSGLTWVIDPIDGTVNYLYGIPFFGVSVAVVEDGQDPASWRIVAGAVADGLGTMWSAAAGLGAFRNDEVLVRHSGPALSHTLLATGFQYTVDRRLAQGRIVAALLGQVRDIRRLGAASIDLCHVAAGLVDAYYEHGLNPWDFAAGALIAREAGVKVAGLDGAAATPGLLIAAMPEAWQSLHDAIVAAGGRAPFERV